jgi:hypothetical protein
MAYTSMAKRSIPVQSWRSNSSLPWRPDGAPRSRRSGNKTRHRAQKGGKLWWVSAAPDTLEARLKRYEALVKVTSDKRFVDDSSADTQDALSEKRKERDELRTALVRDLDKAFLAGTMFYGGWEVELEGPGDLKEPVSKALTSIIPNAYPRFSVADRTYDFAKQLKALLNPSTASLHAVAPELDLFDTQNSLQRESALVAQVLEVLHDLEDESVEATGAILVDSKDRKGFRGFSRVPFGWPDELVRLVLAACFRAGAIYLERQSGTGPAPSYDYRGSDEIFAKVNTFKKTLFRVAETSLSVDQIKEANKALIALGVTGVPESGNAIAGAIRDLGAKLKTRLEGATLREQQGLPIPDSVLGGESALTEPMTAKDPTAAVTAFLGAVDHWKALLQGLDALQAFLDANRHKDFETSRKLAALVDSHPVPESHPKAQVLSQAREDMDAIIAEKAVISRWADYREAYDLASGAYRAAYLQAYDRVGSEAETTVAAIKGGSVYLDAPKGMRDTVVDIVFGSGRACDYPAIQLSSVSSLLEAASRRSLTALEQALVALPGYRAQVEAELRRLVTPPPPPDEKVYEWHPGGLLGRQFRTESDVDAVLDSVADEIKSRIRDGYTVIIK